MANQSSSSSFSETEQGKQIAEQLPVYETKVTKKTFTPEEVLISYESVEKGDKAMGNSDMTTSSGTSSSEKKKTSGSSKGSSSGSSNRAKAVVKHSTKGVRDPSRSTGGNTKKHT